MEKKKGCCCCRINKGAKPLYRVMQTTFFLWSSFSQKTGHSKIHINSEEGGFFLFFLFFLLSFFFSFLPTMSLEKYHARTEQTSILLAKYQSLQSKFTKHSITLVREIWQPIVINAIHLNEQEVTLFINDTRNFPGLDINMAIEYFSYHRYVHDVRYEMGLFADIPKMNDDVGLYVHFPKSYIASSLTKEFMNLENVCFY